ncbi:TPA: hypothetical protein ACGOWH_002139, partial [Streptococcus suis]
SFKSRLIISVLACIVNKMVKRAGHTSSFIPFLFLVNSSKASYKSPCIIRKGGFGRYRISGRAITSFKGSPNL